LCSYLLIGFFITKRSAGDAAKKAFVVNRVGDWGFSIGINNEGKLDGKNSGQVKPQGPYKTLGILFFDLERDPQETSNLRDDPAHAGRICDLGACLPDALL
ncbi:MAG TPA: hypothetical protein EYO90_04405, partial [Candidatus Latescibacteria bacterium]|nr:hypothetical protein [Candidatus Latescibacterota bacterium]